MWCDHIASRRIASHVSMTELEQFCLVSQGKNFSKSLKSQEAVVDQWFSIHVRMIHQTGPALVEVLSYFLLYVKETILFEKLMVRI